MRLPPPLLPTAAKVALADVAAEAGAVALTMVATVTATVIVAAMAMANGAEEAAVAGALGPEVVVASVKQAAAILPLNPTAIPRWQTSSSRAGRHAHTTHP